MEIEEVQWCGDFWNGSTVENIDFYIFIYADDGSGSQPTGSGLDNPEVTALESYFIPAVSGEFDYTGYYKYNAVLDPPFQVQAGVKYWIAIQSVLTYPPQWGWINTDEILLQESVQGFPSIGMPYWTRQTTSVDMAFNLTGQRCGVTDKFDFCFKTCNGKITNHMPKISGKFSGPSNGNIGKEYTYSCNATDPDGHKIQYIFDWDDNTVTWTEYVDSGETISVSHSWSYEGSYIVKVKARDEYCGESDWATLEISIPKAKTFNFQMLFNKFLQNHPHLRLLIQQIMGDIGYSGII
jgi:hypothetical protein